MVVPSALRSRWEARPTEAWIRAAHLLVALWFLATPFLFVYFRNEEATFSTWIGGGLLTVLALSGLFTLSVWEELLSLPVAGYVGWAAVNGGFTILTDAVAIHYAVAGVTMALAAAALTLWVRAGRTRIVKTGIVKTQPEPQSPGTLAAA